MFVNNLVRFYKNLGGRKKEDTNANSNLNSGLKNTDNIISNSSIEVKVEFQHSEQDFSVANNNVSNQQQHNGEEFELFMKVNDILVKVTEEVVNNMPDRSKYLVEFQDDLGKVNSSVSDFFASSLVKIVLTHLD